MPLDDLPAPDQPAPDDAAPAPDAGSAPVPAAPADLPSPFADVLAGSIPAVVIPPIPAHGKPNDVQTWASNHFGDLLQAGLDYHETKDQAVVLFNPKVIPLAKVEAAEKNGTLNKLAVPAKSIAAPAAPAVAAAPAPAAPSVPLASAPMPAPAGGGQTPPGIDNARRQMLAPRQVSPIQPNPVVGRLAQRAV